MQLLDKIIYVSEYYQKRPELDNISPQIKKKNKNLHFAERKQFTFIIYNYSNWLKKYFHLVFRSKNVA